MCSQYGSGDGNGDGIVVVIVVGMAYYMIPVLRSHQAALLALSSYNTKTYTHTLSHSKYGVKFKSVRVFVILMFK